MSTSGWGKFWKDQTFGFNEIMKINTNYFAEQIEKLFSLKPTDQILDYGCGPAFLADYFSVRNIFISGADINNFYIEQGRNKHAKSLFIPITTEIRANKAILDAQLKEEKFDFIILLSITQYFKDTAELGEAINMLVTYLKKDGKIILADVIDQNSSAFKDTVSLFFHSFKNEKLILFFRFVLYLLFSDYRKLSKNIRLLSVPEHSILQIAHSNLLNCEKINGLTIHPSRTSYILTRKSK
jgi:2-polyprenyl-3-methyl-5-hydroxy-6-metoxy-1,4-benzoquinol methylase